MAQLPGRAQKMTTVFGPWWPSDISPVVPWGCPSPSLLGCRTSVWVRTSVPALSQLTSLVALHGLTSGGMSSSWGAARTWVAGYSLFPSPQQIPLGEGYSWAISALWGKGSEEAFCFWHGKGKGQGGHRTSQHHWTDPPSSSCF